MFSELWKSLDVQYMSSISEAAGGAVCAAVDHAAYFLNTCRKATEHCRCFSATSLCGGFDCDQTGADHIALRWRTRQYIISVCSNLRIQFNIWKQQHKLVPNLFHAIELQEHCCSVFPKGYWINHLSGMHCQKKRSRLPVWLAIMWQTGRSSHPLCLWGPA